MAEVLSTVELLAAVESDEAAARAFFKDEFALNPEVPGFRGVVTKLVVAWSAARSRGKLRHAADAEAHLSGSVRALPRSKKLELKRGLESALGIELDEHTCPAGPYVALKLSELEEGELRAEPWQAVASTAEETEDSSGGLPSVTDGALRIARPARAIARVPATTEEFRTRLNLMATCYQMVLLRSPEHPLLEGVAAPLWEEYVQRILSKDVMGWVVRNIDGSTMFTTPWSAVLAYEHEVRKEACRRANSKQKGFGHELRAAMNDPLLYNMKFVLPLSASAAAGVRGPVPQIGDASGESGRKRQRGDKKTQLHDVAKGKGKKDQKGKHNKGKGKGKQGKGKGHAQLAIEDARPGNRATCNPFNSRKGCKYSNCRFAHVCSKCGGTHPAYKCREA